MAEIITVFICLLLAMNICKECCLISSGVCKRDECDLLKDKWISVKDRLPEPEINVKLKFSDGSETEGFYKIKEKGLFRPTQSRNKFHQKFANAPVSWMPLPEPPQ